MSHALRTTLIAAAVALLSATVLIVMARPAHAAGSAEVRFVEPERFSDAGRPPVERDRTLASLTAHLQQLARGLPDGQRLKIEVLDVDLAGEQVLRRGQDVRVLRGTVDSPSIELRWSLEQGGSTVKSGKERLTDLGYLTGGRAYKANAYGDLPYEKRMLSEWFRAQFESPH